MGMCMKMGKRICSVLLLLMLLLTGCGKSTEEKWQEQYDLGMRYLLEENYGEAIVAFTAAIEIEPNQALAYVGRGGAYIGSGETEDNLNAALADYQSAIRLDSMNAEAYVGAADSYIRQGIYELASEILQTGFDQTKDEQIQSRIDEIESGYVFDSSGGLRMETIFGEDGQRLGYYVYSYYPDGGRKEIIAYDADGNETGRGDNTYDEQGRPLQECYQENDGTIGITRYTYNENEVRVESYSQDGELVSFAIRELNEDGKVIRERRGASESEIDTIVTYEYDDRGRLTRMVEDFGEGGRLENLYDYDEDDNCIHTVQYHGDRELSHEIWYEWEDGRLVKETMQDYLTGYGSGTTVYEYDAEGNLISQTEIDD